VTLLYIKKYSRAYIKAHPDWLFVFGDNMLRHGLAGQAAEARGEPNAIGIATKRKPTMEADAFLSDLDYDNWLAAERTTMRRLMEASQRGRTIIWPLDGIGTGLARLEKNAPSIWAAIDNLRAAIQ
jgi:hypothetical protein